LLKTKKRKQSLHMAKNQNERGLKRTRETASSTSPVGVNYLLAIAIDEYQNFPKLYNCVKDANDIIGVLSDKYQFEEEHIFTLFNDEATTSGIFTKFETLAGKIKPIDSLIIYFAGHGEFKKVFNEGYWIPVDARDNSVGQYIPNSEIKTMLTAIKTQHTFLIADSCFSGSLFQRGSHRNVVRRRIERFPSRWGLTSGRSEIVGDGHPGENSPFAKSILYLLKNNFNPLSVQELCAHVTETVEANATQTPIGEPLNIPGHQGGQFVFHLKRNEKRDWLAAKEKDTSDAYEAFVTMYPQGVFFDEADALFGKRKEAEEWDLAIHANTIQGFLIYKKQYPNGPHVDEAIAKIGELEEEKEWSKISRRNRLSDYLKYVRDYPLGKYVDEANKKIALLDVKGTTEKEIPIDADIDENWEETIEDEIKDIGSQPSVLPKQKETDDESFPFLNILKYAVPALLALVLAWNFFPSGEDKEPIAQDEPTEEVDLTDYTSPTVADEPIESIKEEPIQPPKEEPNPAPERPNERAPLPVNTNKTKCDNLMVKANQQFRSKDFDGAYGNYQNARRICKDLTWSKLNACKRGMDFNNLKSKADKLYREGDYLGAKTFYSNALSYFPNDNHCNFRIKECDKRITVAPPPANPAPPRDSRPAVVRNFEKDMVFVGKGAFRMGSEGGDEDERPVHKVDVSSFYIAKYEVTQELYQAVMGENPSKSSKCKTCPVDNIKFNDILNFIKKLNSITGKKYRLPTEAEWEYAARGGNKKAHNLYPGSSINAVAVYRTSAPREVGRKAPNALGLYDMAGNIGEWCIDWYDENYYDKSINSINPKNTNQGGTTRRVIRGGNFSEEAHQLRVTNRNAHSASSTRNLFRYGFRLVR